MDQVFDFLYKILPKFGPLRVLQLKTPTPETERMFQASFNATMDRYRNLLKEQAEGRLKLPNNNFDVGIFTPPGKYRMNDDAHAKLLDYLSRWFNLRVTRSPGARLSRFEACNKALAPKLSSTRRAGRDGQGRR